MRSPDDEVNVNRYKIDEETYELYRAAQIGLAEGRIDEYLEFLYHLMHYFESGSPEACLFVLCSQDKEIYEFVRNVRFSEEQLEYLLAECADPDSEQQVQVEFALFAVADIRSLAPIMKIYQQDPNDLILEILTEIVAQRAADNNALLAVPLFISMLQNAKVTPGMNEVAKSAEECKIISALSALSCISDHYDIKGLISSNIDVLIALTEMELDSGVTESVIDILSGIEDERAIVFIGSLADHPVFGKKAQAALRRSIPPGTNDINKVRTGFCMLLSAIMNKGFKGSQKKKKKKPD
jgi:hypothetical protein